MYRVGPTPESERPLNLKIASLSKRYVFNTPQDADTFLKEGLEICAQEKVRFLLYRIHSVLTFSFRLAARPRFFRSP